MKLVGIHVHLLQFYRWGYTYIYCNSTGGGARTGGSIRGFVVAYAIFGVLLYYWTVNVWSRRITDTLVRLSQICFTSTRDDGPQARQSQEHRARALALWFTLLLVLGAWLGLCPVGVGTPRANYGERLESATMALLLVRPPYPLPQTMESVAILASCITCSHCFILSLLSQVTVSIMGVMGVSIPGVMGVSILGVMVVSILGVMGGEHPGSHGGQHPGGHGGEHLGGRRGQHPGGHRW
ncbi:hypothetical protein FHG87_022152 [Trinorchestia longiramus]|nr:hypothetical protein FHG87_022152 [Trinorchestia longiramus]